MVRVHRGPPRSLVIRCPPRESGAYPGTRWRQQINLSLGLGDTKNNGASVLVVTSAALRRLSYPYGA